MKRRALPEEEALAAWQLQEALDCVDQDLARCRESFKRAEEARAQHCWHWTRDPMNPLRVSVRVYAEAIGEQERIISKRARAEERARWDATTRSTT